MAKQRGVVQLSGRVDNLCYYQQKRVRGGLVRRINLAMSERVKSGSEYINLRIVNSYFGACSMLAAALLDFTYGRFQFSTRSDRQSFLTKELQKILLSRNNPPADGIIVIDADFYKVIPLSYNKIIKVRFSNFFANIPQFIVAANGATIPFVFNSIFLQRYCEYYRCRYAYITYFYNCYLDGVIKNEDTLKYDTPIFGSTQNVIPYIWEIGSADLVINIPPIAQPSSFNSVIFVVSPVLRVIGNRYDLLQSGTTAQMTGIYIDL